MRDRFCSLKVVAHVCSKMPQRLAQCTVYVTASTRTWRANKPLMRLAKHTNWEPDGEEA